MSVEQRPRRLEAIGREQLVHEEARRLAEESGRDVEETTIEFVESYQRIARYGMDAEVRRLAREFGMTQEEARAAFEAEVAKIRSENGQEP